MAKLQPYKEETFGECIEKAIDEYLFGNKETMEEINEDLCVYDKLDFTQEPAADKVELILGDYEIKKEDGHIYLVKKQPQYSKTYEECCMIIGFCPTTLKWDNPFNINSDTHPYIKHLDNLIERFQKLLVCRDAYWKIAGEQMGLSKPWEPDWLNVEQDKFVLYIHNNVICSNRFSLGNNVLAFPTEEMRDAFYENFKELIEQCKELL